MATRFITAARGKGRKNKATRDTSAAPDNPVIAGTSEGQRHGDGATSQHVETTRDEMSFQPSEVRSETLPESGTALTTQASSPMWVNYPELGGNTPPSWTSPGIKEEAQAIILSGIHVVNAFTDVTKAGKTERERRRGDDLRLDQSYATEIRGCTQAAWVYGSGLDDICALSGRDYIPD